MTAAHSECPVNIAPIVTTLNTGSYMKGGPFLFLGVAAYWDIVNALLHVNTHFVARAQVLPVARFVRSSRSSFAAVDL